MLWFTLTATGIFLFGKCLTIDEKIETNVSFWTIQMDQLNMQIEELDRRVRSLEQPGNIYFIIKNSI